MNKLLKFKIFTRYPYQHLFEQRLGINESKDSLVKDELKKAMNQYIKWLDNQVDAIWKNLDHSLDHATKKDLLC